MKVAVVGTGIAGLVCAKTLHARHDITVYEANDYVGGHTHTHDVSDQGQRLAIDTGFIVYNERTYPRFIALLRECGVPSLTTEMTFSFSCERTGLEYNGNNLNTLFAQRSNLLRPRFYHMIRDILRFNREAPRILSQQDDITLAEYLAQQGYGTAFRDDYLLPMAAAIWSARAGHIPQMPVQFFVRFFQNHGLLTVNDRPQWYVIAGGSREYVKGFTAPFADRIRLRSPVTRVQRLPHGVTVSSPSGPDELFDHVVLACHSDQSLALLADPTPDETEILGAIAYQENEAVLHTDTRLLPRRRLAWAAWNYHRTASEQERVAVTYNMNILQRLKSPTTFLVTLNRTGAIRPDRIIARMTYHHPVFTPSAQTAQTRWEDINGVHRTWYAGAYWGYGFHEDGVASAQRVCSALESAASRR